jgi:hypothetical protein
LARDELVCIVDAELTRRAYSEFNAALETYEAEMLSVDGKEVECATQQPMFFWAPWCAAALSNVSRLASDGNKERAEEAAIQIVKCIPIPEHFPLPQAMSTGEDYVGRHGTFELAETIYCLSRVPAALAERWRVEEETPATASDRPTQRDRLSPCHERAYEQFEDTVLLNSDLQKPSVTLAEVYARLCEGHHGPTKLPKSSTWTRYVRKALKYHGREKNTPRTGRDPGKSIVPEGKI